MSIYEYNEEYARKAFFEEGAAAGYANGREDGYVSGREEGYASGKEDGIDIGIGLGKDKGDAVRLVRSVENLMKKLSCDVQEACENIGATVEEYEMALICAKCEMQSKTPNDSQL